MAVPYHIHGKELLADICSQHTVLQYKAISSLLLVDLPKWPSLGFLKTLLAVWGCARFWGRQQCPAPRCELTALRKTPFMTSLPLWKVSSLPPCSLQPAASQSQESEAWGSAVGNIEQRSFSDILAPYTSSLSSSLPVVFPYGACKSPGTQVKSVISF